MHAGKSFCIAILTLVALTRSGVIVLADDAAKPDVPKSDVAKWYAEDPTRLPKCKVDPNIEKNYPDIQATLAALKYALANDKGWAGVTWKQDEDLATVRKGEIDALDDPNMKFGWKPDQTPLNEIKKGSTFNDAVTKSGTLAEFHVHTFLTGNDTDAISPRPPAEVMRTLAHELAHVWDHRAHTITKYSVEIAGHGLPYDFQKLVPSAPFDPAAIREINHILGKPDAATDDGKDDDDPNEEENPNKFFIYAINTSGWSLYIARPGQVEKLVGNANLPDSGLNGAKVDSKKLRHKGYSSKEDAVAYLKSKVKPGHFSKWTGRFVKYNGEEYRTVHLTELAPKEAEGK